MLPRWQEVYQLFSRSFPDWLHQCLFNSFVAQFTALKSLDYNVVMTFRFNRPPINNNNDNSMWESYDVCREESGGGFVVCDDVQRTNTSFIEPVTNTALYRVKLAPQTGQQIWYHMCMTVDKTRHHQRPATHKLSRRHSVCLLSLYDLCPVTPSEPHTTYLHHAVDDDDDDDDIKTHTLQAAWRYTLFQTPWACISQSCRCTRSDFVKIQSETPHRQHLVRTTAIVWAIFIS